jgi:site-specific DNA-methyltransferase (adenine-specific)
MIPESCEKYVYYREPGIVLLHGDCLEILPLFEPKSFDLVLTDPPYNVGIDSWDRIDNYINFIMDRFNLLSILMKDNATFWFTHMIFDVLATLNNRIKAEMGMQHKQLITLDKGLQSVAGRTSDALRSFPRATEYLQFYIYPDPTGAEQLEEQYASINPMAKYLQSEFKRAKVTNKEISKLFPSKTGGLTGCVSNWLKGANFPLEEQYLKIRKYLNGEYLRKEYEELRKEYEELRKEYEELRYIFNLPSGITDVWGFNSYKESFNHASPKPIDIWNRIILAVTVEYSIILDPFLGSGTTSIAAKQLGRKCIGIELEKKYLDIAIERLRQEQLF